MAANRFGDRVKFTGDFPHMGQNPQNGLGFEIAIGIWIDCLFLNAVQLKSRLSRKPSPWQFSSHGP